METKLSPEILEVIAFCRQSHFDAERVGSWVWVTFPEKPPKETRKSLREFGFIWSPRRGKWAHNCGKPSKPAYESTPWETYDHTVISRANG